MLTLAELLSQAGFTISFVNNEQSHRRLDQAAFRRRCPGIEFLSIPDGLPPDHPRSGPSTVDLLFSVSTFSKPIFENLIASMSPPPACIISDGVMSFAIDVAAELGIPAITFRTYSATCTWTCFHLEKLIQDAEIPVLQGSDEDMNKLISCIPGLENIMRRRDLPHICRLDLENPVLKLYITQSSQMAKASALILNTFEELEASPSKSVLYVSFGSVIILTRDQFVEFWYGLVNSEKRFLWAIRPDLIWDVNGPSKVPEELTVGTRDRGRIVGWAPQEDVLAHDAIGGFLTNSTLESICAGKPMICWPVIADQQVNSRCVSEMWKVGLDMKDICERSTVEKLVRDLMDGGRKDIMKSTVEIGRLAQNSVSNIRHSPLMSLLELFTGRVYLC
ncbi:hypothetical protein DH2020_046001 [Rehmannia glutinosa]|uniref:Glycosyltransferase n=1 Tax=Rehmannia glutinosa TaxID=99300 RepID=A0ABR0UDN5_REHGL